jgi:hypothetical protein
VAARRERDGEKPDTRVEIDRRPGSCGVEHSVDESADEKAVALEERLRMPFEPARQSGPKAYP